MLFVWGEQFYKFKYRKFDEERKRRLKVYEDEDLEALLEDDSYQMQEELGIRLPWRKLVARHTPKCFLHLIVIDNEIYYQCHKPKKRKSWKPRGHASKSTTKSNNHCAFGGIHLGSCSKSCLKETRSLQEHNWSYWVDHPRKNGSYTTKAN